MKQTFLFSILAICISCFSCKKDEIKSYKKSLIGDYDWEKSTTGKYGSYSTLFTHSPSNTGNNYGFRIKKNYEIILYKNGNQLKKGKLEEAREEPTWKHDNDGNIVSGYYHHEIVFNFDGEKMIFSDENGMLCKTWPYNKSPNLFTKIR